jgi:pimeloyl-ACP methyl ester carboxylesterase
VTPPKIVCFVHGFASSFSGDWGRTGWADLLLDEGVHAIDVSLPGHNDPTASDQASDYVNIIEPTWQQLETQAPITAIGFSAGAEVLLRAACEHPEAFERLVLLGLGDRVLRPNNVESLVEALGEDHEPDDVRLRVFWRLVESNASPRAALRAFLARDRQPLTASDLASVSCPVLSIVGSQEQVSQDNLAECLPNLQTHTVEGADHFGLTSSFETIDTSLRFLELA